MAMTRHLRLLLACLLLVGTLTCFYAAGAQAKKPDATYQDCCWSWPSSYWNIFKHPVRHHYAYKISKAKAKRIARHISIDWMLMYGPAHSTTGVQIIVAHRKSWGYYVTTVATAKDPMLNQTFCLNVGDLAVDTANPWYPGVTGGAC
jgi:hypothetical protein